MFSRVPTGNPDWSERNMRYMLCAFPLVGVLIGALELLWLWATTLLPLNPIIRALGVTLIPIAVTGGIHLDGFCDAADALASHAPPERKREILKDPRAGAFAIIALGVWLLSYFALSESLLILRFDRHGLRYTAPFALGFVLSRTLSALAVLNFPSSKSGLARSFNEAANKRTATVILVAILILCAAALILLFPLPGVAILAASVACFAYLKVMSHRQFGGMSGDLAGYFLQICELLQLLALVLSWEALPWFS
jgi:adenosylcobinamide-GDP ribazoletransferase